MSRRSLLTLLGTGALVSGAGAAVSTRRRIRAARAPGSARRVERTRIERPRPSRFSVPRRPGSPARPLAGARRLELRGDLRSSPPAPRESPTPAAGPLPGATHPAAPAEELWSPGGLESARDAYSEPRRTREPREPEDAGERAAQAGQRPVARTWRPATIPPDPLAALPTRPDPGRARVADPRLRAALARLTFGATPALVRELERTGVGAFLDAQLDPDSIDDSASEAVRERFELLDEGASELRSAGPERVERELAHATLLAALWSRRQLRERMLHFWLEHFHVGTDGSRGELPYDRVGLVERVLRPGALGRFDDLLLGVTRSPALLRALGNDRSGASGPNEQLAGELLGRLSLGSAESVSDDDVHAAALVLSGWTVDERHAFVFRAERHHVGPLQVLDWSTEGVGGVADGEALVRHLARHEITARSIAGALARHFVLEDPPDALIESAAQVYLDADTRIAPVIRDLVESREFGASPGGLLRRPFELLVAVLRVLNADVDRSPESPGASHLARSLESLGDSPLAVRELAGSRARSDAWLGSELLLRRVEEVDGLVSGAPGVGVDLPRLLPPTPSFVPLLPVLPSARRTAEGLVVAVAERVLPRPLEPRERAVLLEFLGVPAALPVDDRFVRDRAPALFALVLTHPAFQVQ